MKTCDVCGGSLGLIKFRYQNGFICKDCYESASRGYTETVRDFGLSEIKERCSEGERLNVFEDFEMTGRIGNFILIDANRKRICIVNNRIQTKKYKKPEIVSLDQIQYGRICCGSSLPWEELRNENKPKEGFVTFLGLELIMASGENPRYIQILSSPVRARSFAFRKSMNFMCQIVGYLESNYVDCRCV